MNEFRETRLEFFKNLYDFELVRKDNLNSNLNIPLTILSFIAGLLGYFFLNLPKSECDWIKVTFFTFLTFASIAFAISIYFFAQGLFGFGYGYISDASKINKYLKDVEDYNKAVNKKDKVDIENEFYEMLMEQYIEYSTLNFENNNKKSGYLRKTTVSLIVSFSFTILCSISFVYMKYSENEFIYKVHINNFEKGEDYMPEKPKPIKNEVPKPQPPPKPERPKGQIIKEEKEPKIQK
ncbi:hypothetical protein AB3N60_10810 [Leptospira sp. WS39.C2]